MKYTKGNQTSKLNDLELCKLKLVRKGRSEGIWIRQGDGEVILQNHSLAFLPYPSWGVVLTSKYTRATEISKREEIDITDILNNEDVIITLHPEAWDSYIEKKYITEDGTIIESVSVE